MFAPKRWFDKMTSCYDTHLNDLRKSSEIFLESQRKSMETNLAMILEAKKSEVEAVLKAKDEEITFLKQHISDLQSAVSHEQARAEAAIDRLLVKEVHAPPIANADLDREAAKSSMDLKSMIDPEKKKVLGKIFSEVNSVNEDIDDTVADELFESIGGFKVGGGNGSAK